jgi:hypothetical protein
MEIHLPFDFSDTVFLREDAARGILTPYRIMAIEVTKPNGHKINKIKVKSEGKIFEVEPEELLLLECARELAREFIDNYAVS